MMKHILVNLTLMLLILFSVGCFAAYEPPVSRNTTASTTFDRSAIPSAIMIWNAESGGRDDTKPEIGWAENTLTCLSESDTAYGACPTIPSYSGPDLDGKIKLRFTLDNIGSTVDLDISAFHVVGFPAAATDSHKAPWNAIGYQGATFTLFTYQIDQSELQKLNHGGIWRATLKQNLNQWSPRINLATWAANIVLHVTDNQNQQIYFPAYGTKSPIVNLNLSGQPPKRTGLMSYTGLAIVDMCLYDGSNSTSGSMIMRFEQRPLLEENGDKYFHVFRSDVPLTHQSLNYEIRILNPVSGMFERVLNNSNIQWSGLNNPDLLRKIMIPGVPGVSLCVPTKLIFYTPPFDRVGGGMPDAGIYTGRLLVTYTPST